MTLSAIADHTPKEISCRITRTLLLYVRENNAGSLGDLLDGLELDETYLSDPDNWVSHAFLQRLYRHMTDLLGDQQAVYKMTQSAERYQSLGLLDRIVRLLGSPRLVFHHAPKYNRMLKLNGDILIRELSDGHAVLEDRYHDSAQKTRWDCDFTRGVLAGIPTLFQMPVAQVEEIECQVAPEVYGRRGWPDHPSQGARACLYRVRWDQSKVPPVWKRLFAQRGMYRKAIEDLQEANQRVQLKYDETRQLAAELSQTNRRLTESQERLAARSAELAASELKYRLLAENVTDLIWAVRLEDMTFTFMSPSVEKMLGYRPEEMLKSKFGRHMTRESYDAALKVLSEELAREGAPGIDPARSRTMEIQQVARNGSLLWTEVKASFLRDESGKPTAILGVTRDIAERKRMEAEAQKLAQQLERARKLEAVGSLAAGVAHDLNNILGGIVGYPELLLMDLPSDSRLRPGLESIRQSGERAAAVVQDLLTLARRDTAQMAAVNLNRVVAEYAASPECARLLREHPGLRFEPALADDLLTVKGSGVHLTKVIMNMAANAAEAMPAGGRMVLSTASIYLDRPLEGYETIPEGEYIRLRMVDEGVGIAEDHLKRIFDPFFTRKRLGRSGTGLGMTVIWNTVKDHGGFIDLRSQEGQGTRLDVYLPASREPLEMEPERVALEDYLGRERVLVVDDVAEQRALACQMLGKLGYRVAAVAGGEEALAYLEREQADLLVLDMIMEPGIDGLETYRRVIARHPGQKAIIASGYAQSDRVRALQDLGAGAYVRKPYTLEKIGLAVRRELDRS